MRTATCVLGLCLFATACTTGVATMPKGDEPTPTPSAQPSATPKQDAWNPAGTWALELSSAQTFTSSSFDTVSSTITTLARLEIGSAGELVTAEVCDFDVEPLGDTIVTFPDEAVASITVDALGSALSAAELGATFSLDYVGLLGWSADADARTEDLPVDKNDPRVVDADGDTEVGVTLPVSGNVSGDIYGVDRSTIELEGTVSNDSLVEGSASLSLELFILDSSPGFLTIDIQAAQDPAAGPTQFRLTRLADTGTTCTDVLATYP